MSNVIFAPTDNSLSLGARGILGVMLNDPNSDYCTFSDLCKAFANDSENNVQEALNELCKDGYIIRIRDEIFAVNKSAIPFMTVIGR